MIKAKRFLLVFVSLLIIFILASCGDDTVNTDNTQNTNDNTSNGDNGQSTDEDKYYTITFKNDNGDILSSGRFKEGTMPSYNSTPTKENTAEYTYTFNGWNPSITIVTKDAEYVATYTATKNIYTVTWKNSNGEILETDTNVEYGTRPSYNGDTPTKESNAEYTYTFDKWSPEITNVTGNATYIATYTSTKNKYTVIWKNYDGEVLETDTNVEYGTMPSYDGETPLKPSDDTYYYSFSGWTPTKDKVTGDTTYVATFNRTSIPYYTITFKDYDGTILQSLNVKEGTLPTYNKSNPTRLNDDNYSYEFLDWNEEIVVATENKVYVATYKKTDLPYSIIIDLNGGLSNTTKLQFKTDKVSKDILPFDLTKKGYVFKGYELNGNKVFDELGNIINNFDNQSEMTFKAIFEESIKLTIYYTLSGNTYTELFEELGDISKTSTYKFNTYVDLHAYPNEGYTFVGWYNNGYVLSNEKDYKYMMWDEDFTIEARFEYTSYKLNVWSNNYDLGQVMIREGYSQTFYNEETLNEYYTQSVTIAAYTKSDIRFLGWYNELNQLVSTNAVYQFTMPNKNYKLEAKWNYFNVTYDLDGGINNENNPTYYDVDMENITLLEPTKDGYTFIGWEYNGEVITEIETSNICHMELKALWTYYTLTTDLNNSKAGTITSYDNVKVTKGSIVTIEATTNLGYTFDGWYDGDKQITDKPSYTFNMPAEDLVYTAKWTANTNTTYKVEHYLQNLDDNNYPELPYETDNLTGETDTLTNGSVKTYEGFTSPSIKQVNINGDGSTVIKLYYTRNSYDLSLNTSVNDGPKVEDLIGFSNITSFYTSNSYFEIGSLAIQKIFNSGVGVSGINYLGETKTYTYANVTSAGSYDDSRYIKITIPFDGVRLYVAFVTASSNESRAMYLSETRNTTFTDAIAGAYASNVDMAYIDVELGAGVYYLNYTASVRIYEMYLVTCKAGTITNSGTYKYGKEITITATTKPGYTFNGWYDGDNQVSPLETYTFNMPANNLSYTAKWTANTNTTYKVEHYLQNLDDDNYSKLPYETVNLTGETNTLTNGSVKTYEGFTSPTITQVNINGDGSTVIKLYYERNSYDLSLSVNNEKAGSITDVSGTYKYGKEIKIIVATTKPGYTFNGWYDGDNQVSPLETYTFNMPANNLSYTAKWTANTNTTYKVEHYLQNLDDDNYSKLPNETDNLTGETDTLTNGSVKTYEGFTSPSITQININGDGSTVIKLYYERNSYDLSLSINNEKAGSITDVSGSYKYGKEITITVATTNPGYTFEGWYLNNSLYEEESSFNYTITSSNVSFEARYTVNKYIITLDNQAEGVTISGITSGEEYEYDSEITLAATNIPDGYTIKWSRSDGSFYVKNSITFNVPADNITITTTIVLIQYTRNGNKIYFGTYPQTLVEATTENGLSSITFDSSTWVSYKYYIECEKPDFMYYRDVDIDNDGTLDYRGVYFTGYRPCYYYAGSSADNSYQDENGFTTNKIYWFSYDPIEWNVLNEDSGKVLIVANLILDSQCYYYISTSGEFIHNNGIGYTNNYELSDIRRFLNDAFYNTAFNDLQKALIETTIVDNSVSTTASNSNPYSCNYTEDKLFLLSYQEANLTYYSTNDARQANGSDYAKCQGLYVSDSGKGVYWLRSPDSEAYGNTYSVSIVYYTGIFTYASTGYYPVGVRPVCWINL